MCSVTSVVSLLSHQTPLSMGFSRQEYWSGLPCLPPGDFTDPVIEPAPPALACKFFTTEPLGKTNSTSKWYQIHFLYLINQTTLWLY